VIFEIEAVQQRDQSRAAFVNDRGGIDGLDVDHPGLPALEIDRAMNIFLDNARYHHAKLVRQWLARPGCRIKLHFIPSYCPHQSDRAAFGA
jgi:hypothetical protein